MVWEIPFCTQALFSSQSEIIGYTFKFFGGISVMKDLHSFPWVHSIRACFIFAGKKKMIFGNMQNFREILVYIFLLAKGLELFFIFLLAMFTFWHITVQNIWLAKYRLVFLSYLYVLDMNQLTSGYLERYLVLQLAFPFC